MIYLWPMGVASRGRPEVDAQTAAIARVAALLPYHDHIRTALTRVTDSAAFRSGRRAQEFLRYVVEQALLGRIDDLKERSIGVAVFGRVPDYDTGGDAVV